jgi:hypothetical protein
LQKEARHLRLGMHRRARRSQSTSGKLHCAATVLNNVSHVRFAGV